jgi:hypothetical protein
MGTTVSETDGYGPCCSKGVAHPCASSGNEKGSNKVGDPTGSKLHSLQCLSQDEDDIFGASKRLDYDLCTSLSDVSAWIPLLYSKLHRLIIAAAINYAEVVHKSLSCPCRRREIYHTS